MAYLAAAANLPASNAKQHFERKHETISCATKAGNVRRRWGGTAGGDREHSA